MKTKSAFVKTINPNAMAGCFRTACVTRLLPLLLFLLLPAAVQAQYIYTTNNDTITITGYTGSDGAVTIPSTINNLTVTSIGDWAFEGCGLTNITIPASVTSIGDGAFDGSARLTTVTVPASVTSIGDVAFADCTSLRAITVDPSNPAYSSVGGVLFDKSRSTLIDCPGAIGYVVIGDSYTIPATVTKILAWAFGYCNLTSVTIPNSVTSIGDAAFYGDANLTSVPIGNNVTSIGSNAFYFCQNLTSVMIPASVINIEDGAFSACSSLRSLYFKGNAPSLGSGVFYLYGGPDDPATAYYLAGTTGWTDSFGGLPTMLWQWSACTYTLNATSVTLAAKGGSKNVRVKVKGANCPWTAVSNDPFIIITSGSSGAGNGKVNYTVLGNTNTTALTGTMTIAGLTVTVKQALGGCKFSLSPKKAKLKAAGGSATVKVKPNLNDCAWTAVSNDSFITITDGASGTGKGSVTYTMPANTNTTALTGSITIAGETFTITQAGAK